MSALASISVSIKALQAALAEGEQAYKSGLSYKECPYTLSSLRVAWAEGWEEAQLEALYAWEIRAQSRANLETINV
jgi:ribosome modulation factor